MGATNRHRGVLVGALAVGVSTLAAAGSASAGVQPSGELQVSISVDGLDAQDVLDAVTIEVWAEVPQGSGALVPVDPVDCSPSDLDVSRLPWATSSDFDCSFTSPATHQFAIGLDGVPTSWSIGGSCTDGPEPVGAPPDTQVVTAPPGMLGGEELFWYFGVGSAECDLFLSASTLLVDKVIVGGDAAASDFTIEVVDQQGDPVASVSDVADATCEADHDTASCGAVVVPSGTGFRIAEPDVEDYELTSVECDQFIDVEDPPSQGVEPIGDDGFRTDDGDTYCVVTNTYVPPATTTTTTTTTTTATTSPAATTTSIDAGVVTLSQTGPSSSTNTAIAATAAMLVVLGGAMLTVRRRP